ncbi:P-loop containing nucleoside triphosphate hydrolase protein [Trichoderma camerunense]
MPTTGDHNDSSHACTNRSERRFQSAQSNAFLEWEQRKNIHGEASDSIDELMRLQGLEGVKQHFLDIKSKIDICVEQRRSLNGQRYSAVFQGNPGTGKTTVARLYAKFIHEVGILHSGYLKETSGAKLAAKGAKGTKKMLKKMLEDYNGGVLFVDEAYQLFGGPLADYGQKALDIILTFMENNMGKLIVIFAGYKSEMEPFFEHNVGLSSRVPFTIDFADFSENELWSILSSKINEKYRRQMKVEKGLDGLYMRIAIRRISQSRGSRSFGNARTVENLLGQIEQRQARRLAHEKLISNRRANHFEFTKADIIGPDPSKAAQQCSAWNELRKLIGIKQVKDNVERMIGLISANYKRELNEQKPLAFSLNCLFVGNPGTGKTTVAKLYGQILADLGYLSRGDVIVKTPADFIGHVLGGSEANTKKILDATVGKVLVIDEAYMLDAGDPHKGQDPYKTGVIDTIVSMVQGLPGEDRCIILAGYENRLRHMFQNMNPGLSRRFSADRPFCFGDFSLDELESILKLKVQHEELSASEDTVKQARKVLERALLRPGFSNAAEVDTVLATAKLNYEERQSRLDPNLQTYDGIIEPSDIDTGYNLDLESIDYYEKFGGKVHKTIIDQLVRYQKRYSRAKSRNQNLTESVPTRFVFRGPPGTGKSITAQFMGELFHDIGILSTSQVIECSPTDLLAQYVGQTAPKTRNKLYEGLGRVLFIDEAHRLLQSQYAAEALDELIYFLTRTSNLGQVVVILAGRETDMAQLLKVRPELLSLFPGDLVFENIPPADCVTLLERELHYKSLTAENDFLSDTTSGDYAKVKDFFEDIQYSPSWSNARDIKNMALQIFGELLDIDDSDTAQASAVPINLILSCMKKFIDQQYLRLASESDTDEPERQHSSKSHNGISNIMGNEYSKLSALFQAQPEEDLQFSEQLPTKYAPLAVTDKAQKGKEAAVSQEFMKSSIAKEQSSTKLNSRADTPVEDDVESIVSKDSQGRFREDKVPDEIWDQLNQAKEQHKHRYLQNKAELMDIIQKLQKSEVQDRDQIQAKLNAKREEFEKEREVQKALQKMEVCPMGFNWIQMPGGYRCTGGSHFVSDSELGKKVQHTGRT